jgi:hypothetical protein
MRTDFIQESPEFGKAVFILLSLLALAGIGGLSALSPGLGVAGALALGAAFFIALSLSRLPRLFLQSMVVILTGYAFFGKGFAYLGVPPLYIGEAVLVVGMLALVVTASKIRLGVLHFLVFVFMGWGALCTIPYISREGLYAIRDAALWYYALFAIAISLMVKPRHFRWIVSTYRTLVPLFLCWVPIAAVVYLLYKTSIPTLPGSDVQVLWFKGGDMAVHLAGVASFLLLGLYSALPAPRMISITLLWPIWFAGIAIVSTLNRAGMLASGIAIGVVLILRPSIQWVRFLALAMLLMTILGILNPQVNIGRERQVSLGQLVSNARSIVGSDDASDGQTVHSSLEGTKGWRLKWWKKIYSYTFHGPYFWTGKGFGMNLAHADGFETIQNDPLRSPHSAHMTVLARMGVPGLVLWVVLQGAFAAGLFFAFVRARQRGLVFWAQVDVWILVYWLAMMANAAFDVYLEGPQGGIWFWSIFGLGLAALRAQREESVHANTARP